MDWRAEIKSQLAAELGRCSVPDMLWQGLEQDGLVGPNTLSDVAAWRRLVASARRVLGLWSRLEEMEEQVEEAARRGRKAPARTVAPALDAEPSDTAGRYVVDRALGVSAYAAGIADSRGIGAKLREVVTGGRVFSREEMAYWLRSPAVLRLSLGGFLRLGVPVEAHTSEIIAWAPDVLAPYTFEEFSAELREAQREGRAPFEGKPPPGSLERPDEIKLRLSWAHGDVEQWIRRETREGPEPVIRFWDADGSARREVAWVGSVAAMIADVADVLARYFSWGAESAVAYLLTGEAPMVIPLVTEVGEKHIGPAIQPRITIDVEAWVPDEVVLALYRKRQREVLGGPNRRVGQKARTLFRFVSEMVRREGRRPSWKTLQERWNDFYADKPEWQYDLPTRMTTEYHRVAKEFVGSGKGVAKKTNPTGEDHSHE